MRMEEEKRGEVAKRATGREEFRSPGFQVSPITDF